MRRGGTPIALASAVCDSSIGRRKSWSRISPGWGLCSRSVVVDDLDFVGMFISPYEADPPLIVDADRVLSLAITFQGFEPVRRRDAQILEPPGAVDETQLAQGDVL